MTYPTKKLEEVCKLVRGPFGGSLKKEIFVNSGDCVYEQGNVIDNDLENFRYFVTSKKSEEMQRFRVSPGDILMSCSGTIGKLIIIPENFKKGIINQALLKITPNQKVTAEFLKLMLDGYLSQGNIHIKGMAIKNIAAVKELKEIEIPLPPLPEQKRIVKKIEELFAKIDEAKKLRAEAIKDTESLLPSALHKIFSEGKVNGWAEKKIEEVCEHPQYGYTESANSKLVGPKFLRITDIQNGEVNWGYVPYCLCDDVAKYKLKNGDLVFARTGATVGKSYLIKNIPVQSVFASYLIRLRAVKDVLPDFLYYFFQSPDYWQQISDSAVGGAQPNVNGSKLAKLTLFLPPIAEQKKIVTKLDSLSAKVKQLKALQSSTSTDLDALKKSILHKAFNGEL